jgi:thiamine phosphate synthase YjbQ (UPF0047 family)
MKLFSFFEGTHASFYMASSMLGQSLTVLVSRGKLALGTWQSVMPA